MEDEQKYSLVISPGSGWEGANWLLVFAIEGQIPGGGKDRANLGGESSKVLTSFRTREQAEEARDEMLRAFILQAAKLGPISDRRS